MTFALFTASLVGLWIPAGSAPDACASDEAIRYRADGRYAFWWDRGRWRLQRGVLTETVTEYTAASDQPGPAHDTRTSRVTWLGPNRVRLATRGREPVVLARCPTVQRRAR